MLVHYPSQECFVAYHCWCLSPLSCATWWKVWLKQCKQSENFQVKKRVLKLRPTVTYCKLHSFCNYFMDTSRAPVKQARLSDSCSTQCVEQLIKLKVEDHLVRVIRQLTSNCVTLSEIGSCIRNCYQPSVVVMLLTLLSQS